MKLGRKAIKMDARTLVAGKYMMALAPPPASVDWTKGITDFGVLDNDRLGCCTISAVGHAIQIWTANTWHEVKNVTDASTLHYYERWCGYDPNDPSTDQGGVELDVLTSWRKEGYENHSLTAYGSINIKNLTEVKQAIDIFGGVYIGFKVMNNTMFQFNNGQIWHVVPNDQSGVDGGHAVFVPKYDADTLTCITWGKLQPMTNEFWETYVDEAYALVSKDWLGYHGVVSPSGFDLNTMIADLESIK